MKAKITPILILVLLAVSHLQAQVTSSSANIVAWPKTDCSVYYSLSDTGVHKPIVWGLDMAWLSEDNMRRGIAFMGAERVDVVRSSFTPTAALVNGELPASELSTLNERLAILDLFDRKMDLVLNCDHPSIDDWYVGEETHWAELIDVTTRLHQAAGHRVITVSPFNEPDYAGTGQGSMDDFYNIAYELCQNSLFDSVRISGGNTLNCDEAAVWYDRLKGRLDEGNTHQLAGSFDNYAGFYESVRANGDYATNDELHNVMEAMVGVEYGMQTGIWWGTAEYTRSEFVKASDGKRLAYAEHRDNWTAASVYRNLEGKVQGYVGASERQAVETSYRFVSKTRDVFYDGHGPQREYVIDVPGGTDYQENQSNAEGLVNITWGDDIQPIVNGKYKIVNKNSGKVMEVYGGATNAGANLCQGSSKIASYQYWNVNPVDTKIGGDFNYFTFLNDKSGKSIDILNFSLDDGGNIIVWDDTKSSNQQWFVEYESDGWFYIRSRHSAKCLEVSNSSTQIGANIVQGTKDGAANQLWRFVPTDAVVEFEAPSVPTGLKASASTSSVRLDWTDNVESDLAGYTVFRAEAVDGDYNTLAMNVTETAFVDNTALCGIVYYYKIKAMDDALNSSAFSSEVSASVTDNSLLAHYCFEDNALDSSMNLFHGASSESVTYTTRDNGSTAIALNGDDAFVQLPSDVVKCNEMSVSAWVYWISGASWQRIFDFGNGADQYVYLTPKMRFAIKNGGSEQRIDCAALPKNTWSHVNLTITDSMVCVYVNGELVGESVDITVNPFDFKPGINYIGRSQLSTPLFKGAIDDFKIYNYALSAEGVIREYNTGNASALRDNIMDDVDMKVWPIPSVDVVNVKTSFVMQDATLTVYDIRGNSILKQVLTGTEIGQFNVSGFTSGIYYMQLVSSRGTVSKQLIIQ